VAEATPTGGARRPLHAAAKSRDGKMGRRCCNRRIIKLCVSQLNGPVEGGNLGTYTHLLLLPYKRASEACVFSPARSSGRRRRRRRSDLNTFLSLGKEWRGGRFLCCALSRGRGVSGVCASGPAFWTAPRSLTHLHLKRARRVNLSRKISDSSQPAASAAACITRTATHVVSRAAPAAASAPV
jgi:hypothetical protein